MSRGRHLGDRAECGTACCMTCFCLCENGAIVLSAHANHQTKPPARPQPTHAHSTHTSPHRVTRHPHVRRTAHTRRASPSACELRLRCRPDSLSVWHSRFILLLPAVPHDHVQVHKISTKDRTHANRPHETCTCTVSLQSVHGFRFREG